MKLDIRNYKTGGVVPTGFNMYVQIDNILTSLNVRMVLRSAIFCKNICEGWDQHFKTCWHQKRNLYACKLLFLHVSTPLSYLHFFKLFILCPVYIWVSFWPHFLVVVVLSVGLPSLAVNQQAKAAPDQTISRWSWSLLMNWGEGSPGFAGSRRNSVTTPTTPPT